MFTLFRCIPHFMISTDIIYNYDSCKKLLLLSSHTIVIHNHRFEIIFWIYECTIFQYIQIN